MRADTKILLIEYKAKLKAIRSNYPAGPIQYQKFIHLLNANSMKLYSKAELLRLSRLFNNPQRQCPIEVPLGFLQLHSVRLTAQHKYFIITVSNYPLYSRLLQQNVQKHKTSNCLAELLIRLRKKFGNQMNWFGGLGGNPIANVLDLQTFRQSLASLLRYSAHQDCVQQLVAIFLYSNKKQVDFNRFINLVKNNLSPRTQLIPQYSRTFMSFRPLISPKPFQQERHCLRILDKRTSWSTHQNSQNRENNHSFQPRNRSNRKLQISVKKCEIYDRKASDICNFCSFQGPPSMKNRKKQNHRRIKTETNFFSDPTQRVSLLTQEQGELSQSEKFIEILQCDKIFPKQQEVDKAEQYVVLLQNQSGIQIQI